MDEQTDEAAAMAQALGFSSFGSQDRLQKKRKYNPHADAIVDANAAKSQRPNKMVTTGSNSTPLGAPSRDPGALATNADEIDLDGEEPAPEVTAQSATTGEAQASPALVRPAGLPERPAPGTGFAGSFRGGRGGQINDGGSQRPWYEDYYDRSSNENPWRHLEASLGLQPLGTWVSREGKSTAAPA